jgi:hypothetical protein
MPQTDLADFNAWIAQTVQHLREQRWQEIDLPNLIEAVEDLGRSEQRGIVSQLTRLLLYARADFRRRLATRIVNSWHIAVLLDL